MEAKKPTNRPAQGASRNPARPATAKAPARPRPAAQPRARSKPAGRSVLIGVAIVAVVALAFILQFYVFPDGRMLVYTNAPDKNIQRVQEIAASDVLQFSEVMSANGSALMAANNTWPDWIELTNAGSSPMNLEGYTIALQTNALHQFIFPEMTLEPGACVVVYCDNTLVNSVGAELHAPFKLNSAGTSLMLFNPSGVAVESINVPALERNTVYSKDSRGNWSITEAYTPAMANTEENHRSLMQNTPLVASPVIITEFMAANASYVPDETGAYADWIEITNTGDTAVNLNGYGLSDSRDRPVRWKFPSVTLGPGEALIVYCDGKDLTPTNGQPQHTNFSLSTERESVLLSNPAGQLISCVDYDVLKADQSVSLQADGTWTTLLAPTPGYANTKDSAALIEGQFAAQNSVGLFLNEAMAVTDELNYQSMAYDWVELYNASGNTIDLSGVGLSDDPAKPRKWQFPGGASIGPGQYMVVYLSGLNSTTFDSTKFSHANFSLAASGYEELVLSTPQGRIFDRMPLPMQYADISYGRISGRQGFFYFPQHSAMASNPDAGYRDRAATCKYSVRGGLYSVGEQLTVELSCEPGGQIYYTTDCTTPSQSATPYTGPISISGTTLLRTIVYAPNALPSLLDTQSYFFGASHTMDVVSIVTEPDDFFSAERGINTMGPNGWRDTEIQASCEIFSTEGETLISQGCGFRLHGADSRNADQKGFKVIARSRYGGTNRFAAALFDNLPFTEYQSFLIRPSGEDWNRSHMLDSVLSSLLSNTEVLYQETNLCVVYINGQYWGQYNMRERINPFMICQHEGWTDQEDNIDLIKGNETVVQGSNQTYLDLMNWISKNGIDTDEKLAYVDSVVDVENYLEYVAFQTFQGNADLLNVRRYRNGKADGRWRWVVYDIDWAFSTDVDSPRRWLNPRGVGVNNWTDNRLFVALMKNATARDRFLTYMGKMLATDWSTENVVSRIEARYYLLLPEMPAQMQRWNLAQSSFSSGVQTLVRYAESRPRKLLGYIKDAYSLSDEDMQRYFGDAIVKINEYSAASEGGD